MFSCPTCGRPLASPTSGCTCGRRAETIRKGGGLDYGILLPWIPVVGILALLFWIAGLPSWANPGTKILKLMGLTVIVTALLSLLDAESHAGEPHTGNGPDWSGPRWFGLQVLLWPVFYPLYLYTQYVSTRPWRFWIGGTAAGFLVVAALATWLTREQTPMTIARPTTPSPPAVSSVPAAATPTPAEPEFIRLADLTPTPSLLPPLATSPDEGPLPSPPSSTPLPMIVPTVMIASPRPSTPTPGRTEPPAFGVSILRPRVK